MILLIDNYDSFVFNLARYVRELGEESVVRRHDATTYEEIERLRPSHIIISPGPCSPGEAGISTEAGRTEHGYVLLARFLHGAPSCRDTLPDRADGARSAAPLAPVR